MKYLYETHFHTSEVSRCGKVSAKDGIEMYKNAGYSGVLVTDHLGTEYLNINYKGENWTEKIEYYLQGYREAKKYETESFSVMLGAELRFDENMNDYLVLGLTEDFLFENEWFTHLKEKEFKRLCEQNQMTIIQAHPFRPGITIAKPHDIDGIEVFNGNKRHDSANDIAAMWAKKYHLMTTSGSDFHETEDLARGGVYLENFVKNSKSFRANLLAGKYSLKTL